MTLSFFFRRKLTFFSLFIFSSYLSSSIEDYYPYPLKPSSSNYGETGLLEIPTARFMEEGTLKLGITTSYPNEYTFIVASPFSWLEAAYRYTEIKNLKYGPFSYSGNQSLKDKGFDLKVKLLNESYYVPNIAIGIRDLAGTGLMSSEYLVASKTFGDLDLSLGLGWGLLGGDQNINNPFINVSDNFKTRGSSLGESGSFNSSSWFSGKRAAVFGGIEYSLRRYGVNLKLEYDTTNPDRGISGNVPLEVKSRFNFGISRSFNNMVELGLGIERGTELRFSFVLKGVFGGESLVTKVDPPIKKINLTRNQKKIIAGDEQILYRSLNRSLREESLYIQAASKDSGELSIAISQKRFRNYPQAAGRAARVTAGLAPEEVDSINIFLMNGDHEVSSIEFNRKELEKAINKQSSLSELMWSSKISSFEDTPQYKTSTFQPKVNFPEVFWSMSPALKHQIGGPEAFYLGQLWWKVTSLVKFQRGMTLRTVLGFDLYNNFDEFKNPSHSLLPHVRSDIQDYLSEGENNIARMKFDYIWSPKKDWFAKIDIGYFEEMFGGYGGEVYFRPFYSNFSTSLSMHKVKQREYKQRLKFRDYENVTGHLGLYYDFPNGIISKVLVGEYLAGDKGATLDLSRRFKNGFTLGVFATKTNVSAVEFGEGSFDKGFYFSIPIEIFYSKHTSGDISFGLHPLTRDGGAILNLSNPLYSLFGDTKNNSLLRDWEGVLD